LLHNIDIAFVSECLPDLRAQYLIKFADICSGLQILHFVHPVTVNYDKGHVTLRVKKTVSGSIGHEV